MAVEDHSHCEICSRTVPLAERFCGRSECEEKHQANLKDRKKQVYIMVALLAAVMLFSVLMR